MPGYPVLSLWALKVIISVLIRREERNLAQKRRLCEQSKWKKRVAEGSRDRERRYLACLGVGRRDLSQELQVMQLQKPEWTRK